MEPDSAERRSVPRLPFEQPVSLRITQSGHLELTGITRDISTEGVYLRTESDIEEGSDVELLVTLPAEDQRVSMTVRGRVVRVERSAADSTKGLAIAFRRVEVKPAKGRA